MFGLSKAPIDRVTIPQTSPICLRVKGKHGVSILKSWNFSLIRPIIDIQSILLPYHNVFRHRTPIPKAAADAAQHTSADKISD